MQNYTLVARRENSIENSIRSSKCMEIQFDDKFVITIVVVQVMLGLLQLQRSNTVSMNFDILTYFVIFQFCLY